MLHLWKVQRFLKKGGKKGILKLISISMPSHSQQFQKLRSTFFKVRFVKRKFMKKQKQKGFTLIELMVVLVIIGVLAALVVPNVLSRTDDAKITAAKTDISALMSLLKLYKLDNQKYPSNEEGLEALVKKPISGVPNWRGYSDKLPKDPWGNNYVYVTPGISHDVDIISLGADGKIGGENLDADIGVWD